VRYFSLIGPTILQELLLQRSSSVFGLVEVYHFSILVFVVV